LLIEGVKRKIRDVNIKVQFSYHMRVYHVIQ